MHPSTWPSIKRFLCNSNLLMTSCLHQGAESGQSIDICVVILPGFSPSLFFVLKISTHSDFFHFPTYTAGSRLPQEGAEHYRNELTVYTTLEDPANLPFPRGWLRKTALGLCETEFRTRGKKTSILILNLPQIYHRPSSKALKCSILQ